ncbi:unnamed protein product [Notodromas monacha]|uniref:MYND-type domain-containing protein n=1 Tax=Notodromas monacha TaxID=399045 RepID=A0A7R9BRS6_9CRUS|nr:unnamed protein product [Notodromas monacha]CAG0919114.1 unnamed protein product [Notodromas monacha]
MASGDSKIAPGDVVCTSFNGFVTVFNTHLDASGTRETFRKELSEAPDLLKAYRRVKDIPVVPKIKVLPSTFTKDSSRAEQLKSDGEAALKMEDFKLALVKFNGAVLHAKSNVVLADIYLRRAKTLFCMKDYLGCLENISMSSNINPELSGREDLMKMREDASKFLQEDGIQDPPSSHVALYEGGGESTTCALSSKVEVEYSETKGHHMLVRSPIDVGENLGDESPTAAILYPRFWEDHCQHCMKWAKTPTPCSECAAVAYCSQGCLNMDQAKHSLECAVMYNLLGNEVGDALIHLGFRIMRDVPVQLLMDNASLFENLGSRLRESNTDPKIHRLLCLSVLKSSGFGELLASA